jgi:NTP pyrophosphatase (non-canonical NTP hydrolase)
MHLSKIQAMKAEFEDSRGWNKFPASLVFTHLVEELGEISRHITFDEGYKVSGLGHEEPKRAHLKREFAQVFSLFIQLANHYEINLEECVLEELEIMNERFSKDDWTEYMNSR